MSHRISVALCTFNGGAHLRPQLDSLLAQTRLPDEAVVCDDGSTDGTVDALARFAAGAPFPVHVHCNADRLGPAQNFGKAVAACTGDVIACCDQDDVWLPHKLATLVELFEVHPDLGFAFSDAEVIDAAGRPLGYRLWDSVGFTPGLRRRFAADPLAVLVRQNVVTGATLAFAGRLRPLVLPIGPGWMHDGWIGLLASAVTPAVAIPQPLVQYRQHAAQSIGAERLSLRRQIRTARGMGKSVFDEQAAAYAAALDRLSAWPGVRDAPLRLIGEKVAHCRTRSAIRLGERRRLRSSVGELASLRYRRFSLGWKSFAQDLFL